MGWSTDFKTALARRSITISYYVNGIAIFGSTGGVGEEVDTPGGGAALCTAGRSKPSSGTWYRGIDPLSVQFSSQTLDLRTCTYAGGQWSFDFIWESTSDREAFYNAFTRGTPIAMSLAIGFMAPTDAEPIALGVIVDLVEQGRRISVRCWDLISVLHPRMVKATWPILFAPLNGVSTAINTTGYTAGDATVYVADASIFTKADSLGYYVARITPDSGDPFYVRFTGVDTGATPNELTGVTGAQYGTTAADAGTGQTVIPVALCEGTPFEIARQILTSTGDPAYNGADDVLPAGWGYGLDVDRIDDTDMDLWEAVVAPGSGAHLWSYLRTAGDENGLGTLSELMAQGGMWLCLRQGRITARALQDLWGTPQTTGDTIGYQYVMPEGSSVLPRDPGQPFEYVQVRVTTDGGAEVYPSSRSNNRTWPLEEYREADLSSVIFSNEGPQRDAYGDRLQPWYVSVPERIRLQLVGLQWMRYAIGDVVSVEISAIRGFLLNDTDGLDGTVNYMIVGLRWGLPAPWVELDLAVTPEDVTDERG